MRRVFPILLALILLISCMVLPVSAGADSIYATGYREQYIFSYSWSTGKSTGTSHAFSVYFHNSAKRDITSFMVTMKFYDQYGAYLGTTSSDWQNTQVNSGKAAWTPYVSTEVNAASFIWKLTYKLSGDTKNYSSPESTVAMANMNTWLQACRSWTDADRKDPGYLLPTTTALVETSFQHQYLFNVNSDTGSITGSQMYFRTFLKNRGANLVKSVQLSIQCMDSNGQEISQMESGWTDVSLKNDKGAWSEWFSVPLTTDLVRTTTSYICD